MDTSTKVPGRIKSGFESLSLGDLAEAQVKHWATQLDFIVNEAHRDRRGWDQYFEFRAMSKDDPIRPHELTAAALSCKVQIKGTKKAATSLRLKLNNLFLFIQEPIPCFIIVLQYGKKDKEPSIVYLVHVYDRLISDVLERILRLTRQRNRRFTEKRWK